MGNLVISLQDSKVVEKFLVSKRCYTEPVLVTVFRPFPMFQKTGGGISTYLRKASSVVGYLIGMLVKEKKKLDYLWGIRRLEDL